MAVSSVEHRRKTEPMIKINILTPATDSEHNNANTVAPKLQTNYPNYGCN